MSMQATNSDSGLLGLLRITGPLTVLEMADAQEVTSTAVRQRLMRLMDQDAIQREATIYGRGRPRHSYSLTDKGLLITRSNFTDLAMKRWEEMYQKSTPSLRHKTLRRIARELAAACDPLSIKHAPPAVDGQGMAAPTAVAPGEPGRPR